MALLGEKGSGDGRIQKMNLIDRLNGKDRLLINRTTEVLIYSCSEIGPVKYSRANYLALGQRN